jgi:single-stranded-DNA-specific exonuclease
LDGPVKALLEAAGRAADVLRARPRARIITHIDADGICAGAIAYRTLRSLGHRPEVDFVKQLDDFLIERLAKEEGGPELVWFTDLGSGQLDRMRGFSCLITDHHLPAITSESGTLPDSGHFHQFNPHLCGVDGAQQLSGAGSTFLVARAVDAANASLAPLAIVGAVGDIQHQREGRLSGVNALIVEEARAAGLVDPRMDLALFGRETRPVHKMLQYASPAVPGVTGSELGAMEVVRDADVEPREGERWRTWADLSDDERRRVVTRLGELLLMQGHGHASVRALVQEAYVFSAEERGSETRDAMEFSTLLNACGRYGMARIGMEVCLGDRLEALTEARRLLGSHRARLVDGLRVVQALGVARRRSFQYFHARDQMPDTIVGTVASMALNALEVDTDPCLPIVALVAKVDERGVVKVSARGTRELVEEGLDLAKALHRAASSVGGVGGGHDIAAGASIPEGTEPDFLDRLEAVLLEQVPSLRERPSQANDSAGGDDDAQSSLP